MFDAMDVNSEVFFCDQPRGSSLLNPLLIGIKIYVERLQDTFTFSAIWLSGLETTKRPHDMTQIPDPTALLQITCFTRRKDYLTKAVQSWPRNVFYKIRVALLLFQEIVENSVSVLQ